MTKYAQVLTIAGSDSGGGAGIQADLKTFQMRGAYGLSVITATTAQNTLGVNDIHVLPEQHVRAQIQAVAQDFEVNAFKIGMLANAAMIECVADELAKVDFGYLVLDPVMVAKGGAPLLENDALQALKDCLLPRAHIVTPNLPEAELLTNMTIRSEQDIQAAAKSLLEMGANIVVIKGGHSNDSQSNVCMDYVFSQERSLTLSAPRFPTAHTHGTGCTFSACIAAELAKGGDEITAIQTAKTLITQAISHPINIGHGHGPVNHWQFQAA